MTTTLTAEAIHLSRDFFKHPSVKAVEKEFGFKGSKLLIDILIEVTETGFEEAYNKSFRDKIAERNNVSERLVDMVVNRMLKNGFLDQVKYDDRHVVAIPSGNIVKKCSKEYLSLPYFFLASHGNRFNSEEMIVNSEETHVNSEETTNDRSLLLK